MSAITLKNREVLGALAAVTAIQAAKASGKFKLKCARIAAVLRADEEKIRETLTALQKDAIELDEKGEAVPQVIGGRAVPNTVVYKDLPGFEKAQRELLDATHEFELQTFTADELESLEFEGSIEGVLPLIAA